MDLKFKKGNIFQNKLFCYYAFEHNSYVVQNDNYIFGIDKAHSKFSIVCDVSDKSFESKYKFENFTLDEMIKENEIHNDDELKERLKIGSTVFVNHQYDDQWFVIENEKHLGVMKKFLSGNNEYINSVSIFDPFTEHHLHYKNELYIPEPASVQSFWDKPLDDDDEVYIQKINIDLSKKLNPNKVATFAEKQKASDIIQSTENMILFGIQLSSGIVYSSEDDCFQDILSNMKAGNESELWTNSDPTGEPVWKEWNEVHDGY